MNFNTSDYFTYKKNKLETEPEHIVKPTSKVNFLLQIFVATFIIMFILIAVAIMKYSSRVDIEFAQGELSLNNNEVQNNISGLEFEEKQAKIDKRLILIQQEENAPSEAKIIAKQPEYSEVIDATHLEKNNKIEKEVKADNEKNKQNLVIPDKEENKIVEAINEIKNHSKKVEELPLPGNKNITVMSKVLIGKYLTFEDAQKGQEEIKAKNPSLKPFVKKIGEIYSVQAGSFSEFDEAKKQAQFLKSQGLDVWIYQQ